MIRNLYLCVQQDIGMPIQAGLRDFSDVITVKPYPNIAGFSLRRSVEVVYLSTIKTYLKSRKSYHIMLAILMFESNICHHMPPENYRNIG